MSKSQNVFTEDTLTFLTTVVDLDHVLSLAACLHRFAESGIEKTGELFERNDVSRDRIITATRIAIHDLFVCGHCWPFGGKVTQGNDIGLMVEEIEGRMNASLLTVLHESLEIYIRGAYAKLLFFLRDEISLPNRADFHEYKHGWRKYRGTCEYFNDYSAWSCRRDCKEALRMFKKLPSWDQMKVAEWRGMGWDNVVGVLAISRHCIVHGEGRVSEGQLKRLNKSQREFICSMMKESRLSGDKRILPSKMLLKDFIEIIGSLVYGIYVLLSQRCHMEVEHNIFEKP